MIDMDSLCVGHLVFELASTFNAYVGFGEMDPTSIQRFMKLNQETGKQIWRKILPPVSEYRR